MGLVGRVDDAFDLVEGVLVNDRPYENFELLIWASNGDLFDLGVDTFKEFFRSRLWEINARSSRALLTLILKGATNSVAHSTFNVCRGMYEMKVLSTGFSNHTRKVLVSFLRNTLSNLTIDRSKGL